MRLFYSMLLELYPRDFKASFRWEMMAAFDRASAECRQLHRGYVGFVSTEMAGLLIGAAAEWLAKLTTDATVRGRCVPDRLLMRPPGIPWDEFHCARFDEKSERSTMR